MTPTSITLADARTPSYAVYMVGTCGPGGANAAVLATVYMDHMDRAERRR
jgi:hypothetical protein